MHNLPRLIITPPLDRGGGWAGLVLEVRGGDGNFDGEDALRGGGWAQIVMGHGGSDGKASWVKGNG